VHKNLKGTKMQLQNSAYTKMAFDRPLKFAHKKEAQLKKPSNV